MSISVSTHVLDTAAGHPAPGVEIELWHHGRIVAAGETDDDGRIATLGSGLEAGEYLLVFRPESPFFTQVALGLTLEDGHYHVPLLVSPYGCASYRGS